jgi:hypothetical protein
LLYYSVNSTIDKIGLTSLRFVNARNPFTVLAKSNKGYDPEASSSTANNGNVIQERDNIQYKNFWWKHQFNFLNKRI